MDRCYETEFRGSIAVKGKGEMRTHFVVGKKGAVANNLSRQPSQISSLATVVYGMVQARRRQNTVKKRHFHREFASTNNTNYSCLRGKVVVFSHKYMLHIGMSCFFKIVFNYLFVCFYFFRLNPVANASVYRRRREKCAGKETSRSLCASPPPKRIEFV